MTGPSERPWTTSEVADYYRVTPRTVLAWVKSGRLPVLRRRPKKRGHGACLFSGADVLAIEHEGRDVNPADVAAIINAEMRQRKRGSA